MQSDYPHIIPFKIGAITNYSIINVRIFPSVLWPILQTLHIFIQNGFGLITMWKLVESRMLKSAKDINIYPILYLISQFVEFVAGIKISVTDGIKFLNLVLGKLWKYSFVFIK